MIKFEQLSISHFSLLHKWLNTKHVQEFYALRPWSYAEVEEKYLPYIAGAISVNPYLILYEGTPIGLIQYYSVKEYPWPDQDLPPEIVDHAAGIDLFIGEVAYLGMGLGRKIIEQFLEAHIWPRFKYCLADPYVRNEASIRMFEKAEFERHKVIESKDDLGKCVRLVLMMAEREG